MLADADLGALVSKIHDQSFGTYGCRRVTAELRLGLGRQVNHKHVERLMRERGLAGVTRRRRGKGCTRSRATDPRSDDLVHRQFRPEAPNRLWVQDVTQHRSGEGWVYLAVVIDAWSRRLVGWSIADHMRAELVADAIDMATLRRRPPTGAIAHSDHGSNYCSWVFGQRLRAAGLLGSMGTIGDALDYAVAESFFASLNANSSTATPGPPEPGLPERCSTGSRPSTTRPAAAPPSATSAPWTSRPPQRHDHHTPKPSVIRGSLHDAPRSCCGRRSGWTCQRSPGSRSRPRTGFVR
jgi:putative transposase